jgi:hypothetical protein
MKYFVLALIIGLVLYKLLYSNKVTPPMPKITPAEQSTTAGQVPTSVGEGSDSISKDNSTESGQPELPEGNQDNQQTAILVPVNPSNRIMIDQASPSAAGAGTGIASQQTRSIETGTGSPLNQTTGQKLDPSSFVQDQGSHGKIFGNLNGGGSPEAKGVDPGGASLAPLDKGSPVKKDKSSFTIEDAVD